AVGSDIATEYPERSIREHILRAKMRSLDFHLAVQAVNDPRAAYLITWTAMVNRRQYATTEPGIKLLGRAQPRIVELAREIESDIVALGYRYFPKETMDAAIDDIEESALEFLWDSPVMTDNALAEAQDDDDLLRILALPLTPFTSIGKIGNTPEAIRQFSDTANDFSLVIRYLPERMRWQVEMILLEMESSGPTAAMVKEIQNVEKRIDDLIALFKTMPSDIGKEFEKSIEVTKKSLPEFRATLTQVQATAEKSNVAIENASKTVLQAEKMAAEFTDSAKAFEAAAVEVRGLLADLRQWQKPKEPDEPAQGDSQKGDQGVPEQQDQSDLRESEHSDAETEKESGSLAKDYDQMAVSIQAAAQEVRTLVSELQQVVEEEDTLRQVSDEFRGLVGAIFWYAVALAGIIFVLALASRLAARRWVPKRE
ncbi:MAG: hypothetical protein O7C75_07105, partial [Verrucomicrobia bacterium]|nr:hypothetical protein [Verrucomicrobiota bacterium]